jgi:hypothetical protein
MLTLRKIARIVVPSVSRRGRATMVDRILSDLKGVEH